MKMLKTNKIFIIYQFNVKKVKPNHRNQIIINQIIKLNRIIKQKKIYKYFLSKNLIKIH